MDVMVTGMCTWTNSVMKYSLDTSSSLLGYRCTACCYISLESKSSRIKKGEEREYMSPIIAKLKMEQRKRCC